MSLKNYVQELDYTQLHSLKELVEEKIKEIDDSQKIKIWCVSGPPLKCAYFKEDDFLLAKKKLVEYILDDSFSVNEAKHRDGRPTIRPLLIHEHELEEYLSIND